MKNKRAVIFIFIIILFMFAVLFIAQGNKAVEVNEIKISNIKIPENFNGFRIIQISDLHNAEFGKNNSELLDKIKESNPDIIFITGDMIDSRHTNYETGIDFAKKAQQIAPVYYVPGNHESRLSEYEITENELSEFGITVLKNKAVPLNINGDEIIISGIIDPAFYSVSNTTDSTQKMLDNIKFYKDKFTILLSHRPETFDTYVSYDIDLIFSGHAHGGQIRVPFIGGLVAPGQGLFPKYDSGVYTEQNTTMIVSRGLGNSIFPFRVNNNPEIIVVELLNNKS